ncbi:FAD-dependent oxidoreductase [Candidatus Margulisiibacteriota bacterium]
MKVIIIGGVAGGASTATRLRRNSEDIEIIMLERGPDISFANCGMPYYLGEVIKHRSRLTLVSPKYMKAAFNIDVRVNSEAINIDLDKKSVTIKDLATNKDYSETYDKLVLSPGAYPLRPPIPGIDDKRIFTLRNLIDMDKIKEYLDENKVENVAIIGGGFIGLEMAENIQGLGKKVTVIELASQVMAPLDYEMACFVHTHLKEKGVNLILNDGVKQFLPNESAVKTELQSGNKLDTDMVLLAIGVKPDTKLAKEAGLAIGEFGGIKVNSNLQTGNPDIYALGDATEIINLVTEKNQLVPLANSANKQGRTVADNICGKNKTYTGTPCTAIAKIFDLNVASTGCNEKLLKKETISYRNVLLAPANHAGYYPDADYMTIKLIYSPENYRILGAQIIGGKGVDKRIDVISAMLQNNKTVYDLAKLELAYAPPFSSAKDPVNLAGMIAINQIEGRNPVVEWHEVEKLQKEGAVFLDARTRFQYETYHIPNAINIPLTKLREESKNLPKDKKIIVYCNQGKSAYFALKILQNLGFENIFNLNGGMTIFEKVPC